MSYLSVFELRADEANYGKIVVSNNDPAPAGSETAFVYIEGPLGVIKEQDLTTPDIDLGAADNEFSIDIPTDSLDEFLKGDYVIKVQDIHPVFGTRNFTYTFEFCPLLGTPALDVSVNCVCATATFSDKTVYGEGATIARTMTIIPPTIPGQAAPSNIVTAASSYTVNLTYTNVKYQVNLEVELNSNPITGVTVLEKISYSEWFDIVCDYDLCSLITCVNKDLSDLDTKAASAGGYKNLPTDEFDRFLGIMTLLFKHNNLVECQDYDGVEAVYNELKELINCDCECTSTSSDGPQSISSACGAGGPTLSVSATDPIIANLNGSTWELSFSASYKATLDALRVYSLISTSLDLVLDKSYDAGSNTQTVDLSLKVNTWNEVDETGFTATFQPGAPVSSRFYYRLVPGGFIECIGQLRINTDLPAWMVGNPSKELLGSFLAADYRPDNDSPWYPVQPSTGATSVGAVRLNTSGQIEVRNNANWNGWWGATGYLSFHFIVPKQTPPVV